MFDPDTWRLIACFTCYVLGLATGIYIGKKKD